MKEKHSPGTIISVGGGKGGVGKSILSIGLGTVLARSGKSVVLADLDLGSANLHTYLGVLGRTPTIADFILNKVPSLENLMVETSERNLGLISGAEFVPGVTNPAHWMKRKLMRHCVRCRQTTSSLTWARASTSTPSTSSVSPTGAW